MKKSGHLNRDIARVLACMGHTDCIVIADCGLPIPAEIECIDVSLHLGAPGFNEVLDSVLSDFKAERAVFANESQGRNPAIEACIPGMVRAGVVIEYASHEIFKERCRAAKAVIRTGEATPYSNVILYSGVIF